MGEAALLLPNPLDAAIIENSIYAEDWNVLCKRLRHNQPIERIAVMIRHSDNFRRMLELDRQDVEAVARDLVAQIRIKRFG